MHEKISWYEPSKSLITFEYMWMKPKIGQINDIYSLDVVFASLAVYDVYMWNGWYFCPGYSQETLKNLTVSLHNVSYILFCIQI